MISFRDVETRSDVERYATKLANGYAERPGVINHLVKQIEQLQLPSARIGELCVGPGELAAALGSALPGINYVGLDYKQPFLDYTAEKLSMVTSASFVRADLTGSDWPDLLGAHGPFQVIVSLQSLHDVGGAERVSNIYQACRTLLEPGGLFINADLGTPAGQDPTSQPNRLTTEHHLYLLLKAGYTNVACTYQNGAFACCQGSR